MNPGGAAALGEDALVVGLQRLGLTLGEQDVGRLHTLLSVEQVSGSHLLPVPRSLARSLPSRSP